MRRFIEKFADRVDGILCGFDRLVLRGELRALYRLVERHLVVAEALGVAR
jgi:hypothetical protein